MVRRINDRLDMFAHDQIGLADYASIRNGGQVLEPYTSRSYHYKIIDNKYEVIQYSLSAWSQLFYFSKNMENSVK